MSADRFAEVERLYHEALSRPAEERGAFLDQACDGDDALRHEVESLLTVGTDASEFLLRPALEEAARMSHRRGEVDSWPTIPGYTVRRVLGEGGMGVVYLAEQETPFRRMVALKLIKPGMDTRQVVARFETERQALALMDHPNIAAVFDAGSTKEGRPYFVMEYVDGVAITDYCDRGRLTTRDRLALFVQVCAAVQHAHQKGVVHRDLKPSNVLVAELDGRALPKVIDFGTAKAVGGAWNATLTQGGQGMVLGTLEYMSPEQAALSADIDTATDVYSLGVLLYELLVGRLPFDTDELRAAGYDEIRRVIRESDPPRPSARVEQGRGRSGPAARARQTDAPGLTRQLRGDLDWITLKALEKDRTRRYATVAAFATDIGRFLNDQPVEARPPSSTYRIRKFTRRHRLAVAAAAIIFSIIGVGFAVTTGLYWRLRATLQESTYLAYTATLAAAAGDLRNDAAQEAQARLLTVPEAQRGWEWQHLFIQTDESVSSFASAAPLKCHEAGGVGELNRVRMFSKGLVELASTALSLDADGESILFRRCNTLERWSVASAAHTTWYAPPGSLAILAENFRGQVLTLERNRIRSRFHVVLTGSGSAAAVTFGPFAAMPICADISTDGGRVAFGLDTVALASVREDRFEVWNIATGRHEFTLIAAPPAFPDTRTNASCRIRFSPDGRRIATSGARVDVWETATGARRATDALQAGVNSQPIAFSGDSARLAIGRPNGLVAVLHLERSAATVHQLAGDGLSMDESIPGADRTLQTLLRRKREVLTVAFSRDGQTVVSGTSTAVGVWDVRQSKLVRVLTGHAFDVTGLAVTADGRWIYSADAGGVVRTWPASSAPAVVRIPGSSANLLPFSASADGTAILTTEPYGDTLATVRLADLHREFIRVETGKSQGLMRSAISPDGLRVFAVDDGGVIRRWTIGKGSVTVSTSLKSRVKSLVVSPTGTLLAFTDGNSVDVWDASMLKQLATVEMLQTPTELLFRDDETLIVLMESQQVWFPPTVLSIWNWRTNSVLAELDPRPLVGSDNVLWRFALSPTGRRIALILHKFGTPSTVSIWDSDLKAEVGRLPPGDYAALAFSHDGRRIVSVGSEENAVRVWDAERFRLLLTLPDTDSHRGGVAFTRAGQIIAGRTGGGFTIWDTQIRQR